MNRRLVLGTLCAALFTAGFLALFASSKPDGLERATEALAFQSPAEARLPAPAPGYRIPFIRNKKLSGMVAGAGGVALVFGLALGSGRLLKKGKKDAPPSR